MRRDGCSGKGVTVTPDPRVTLSLPQHLLYPEDSVLWSRLLTLAAQRNNLLYRNLQGFRVEGTRIVRLKNGGYGLRPVIAERLSPPPDCAPDCNGWKSEAQYRYYADKYLKPHHGLLVELLGVLGEEGGYGGGGFDGVGGCGGDGVENVRRQGRLDL